jgi:hypothetical protein
MHASNSAAWRAKVREASDGKFVAHVIRVDGESKPVISERTGRTCSAGVRLAQKTTDRPDRGWRELKTYVVGRADGRCSPEEFRSRMEP